MCDKSEQMEGIRLPWVSYQNGLTARDDISQSPLLKGSEDGHEFVTHTVINRLMHTLCRLMMGQAATLVLLSTPAGARIIAAEFGDVHDVDRDGARSLKLAGMLCAEVRARSGFHAQTPLWRALF